VRAAGLQHPPEEARIDTQHDRTSIDLQRWHEPGKMEVRAYRVNGGGHTIPLPSNADECTNIAAPSRDMNTVYEAWNFFLGNRRHSSAQ
jgi:poly(3-hydroxybutyrate) depolymerase